MAVTAVSPQDARFATKAAQAGMAEVQLANLALHKSKSPSVLGFARQMKADHGEANTQLAGIVKAKGMTLPSSIGPKDQALLVKLESESGTTFDATYLQSQLPAHKKVLALFRLEASNGADGDLVAFAKQTIPVIQSHISMDRRDMKTASMSEMAAGKQGS